MDVRTPLLTALLLAGCLGDVPTGGNTGGGTDGGSADPAAAAFTTTLTPIFSSTMHTCTAATCHGGVQQPNLTSWALLKQSVPANKYINKPGASNFIVTKMEAPVGMHEGVLYLSADEKTTVASFMDMYGM